MNRVVIIGAGGLGRQALAQLQADPGHGVDWLIEGFLDERGPDIVPDHLGQRWLGTPHNYMPAPGQLFVAAVGDPFSRERQVEPLLAHGAQFMPVQTRVLFGSRTQAGPSFFGYDVSTGVDARVGSHCFIDQGTLLGHDVVVADYVHIGQRCLVAGYVTLGKHALIHSGAMIARQVSVGEGAVVAMGAVVFHDVPAGATMAGNPARVVFNRS